MELLIKESFFDDPEKQEFWNTTNFSLQGQAIEIVDNIYIIENGELTKRNIGLVANYLLVFKQQIIYKWSNINNLTMERIKKGQGGQGLLIVKNQQGQEFYGEIEMLFNYLKRYCVQRNFTQHYTLVKKIGQGNFAEVFKAVNKLDSTEYAIKCFRKRNLSETVDRESIIKETSILRKLQHDSILKLYEVFEGEEYLYMVLEYLKGGELHKYMKKSPPFSEEKCSKLIYKLLKTVAYIHDKGMLHRDIKPENIMLRRKDDLDDICLCDFGLADYYTPSGKYLFTRCGTPGYVAPELLQDKVYDYKIDVYSIGILMFILIAGKSPFDGKDYDDVVMRNYYAKVKFEECKLSEAGMSLLQGLMNKNPVQRLSCQDALNHQWFIQEKLTKSCQFKIRRQNHLKTFRNVDGGSPLQLAKFLSPKHSVNNVSPFGKQTLNSDDSPNTLNTPGSSSPKTPITPLQNVGKPIRKSHFKLQQL